MFVLSDPLLVDYNPILMLSPPNYLLFVGLWVNTLYITANFMDDRIRSRQVIAAIAGFCTLEGLRWVVVAQTVAVEAQQPFFGDPTTYVVLAAVGCPLILAIWTAWRKVISDA